MVMVTLIQNNQFMMLFSTSNSDARTRLLWGWEHHSSHSPPFLHSFRRRFELALVQLNPNKAWDTGNCKNPLDLFGEYESYEQDHDKIDMFDDESTTFGPGQQTSTLFPMQSRGIEEVIIDNDNSSNQSQGTSWLLIGLLVPLCIFIVVMAVLGIIYCTRYTVKPQNKNTIDCYHWIAGAGDKRLLTYLVA